MNYKSQQQLAEGNQFIFIIEINKYFLTTRKSLVKCLHFLSQYPSFNIPSLPLLPFHYNQLEFSFGKYSLAFNGFYMMYAYICYVFLLPQIVVVIAAYFMPTHAPLTYWSFVFSLFPLPIQLYLQSLANSYDNCCFNAFVAVLCSCCCFVYH